MYLFKNVHGAHQTVIFDFFDEFEAITKQSIKTHLEQVMQGETWWIHKIILSDLGLSHSGLLDFYAKLLGGEKEDTQEVSVELKVAAAMRDWTKTLQQE